MSDGKKPTLIWSEIDYDKKGKQIGVLHLPYSVTRSGYGMINIPIAVIQNGEGPSVLLMAGNHGDEYEGQVTLARLIHDLETSDIRGRVIILPAANLPAAMAGARVSPLDSGNLNRAFPGDPLGSPTQQIVAYVNDVLFPMADAFLDLHSGGSSLMITPSAIIEPVADPERHGLNTAATLAFGAPMTVAIDNRGDPRTATASAARAGLTVVGTEMAGAGAVSIDALALCRRGVRNVLAHLGALPPEMADPPKTASRVYELPGPNAYVLATDEGVFEPFHANGAVVRAGQPAGRIHFLVDPSRRPAELAYGADGVLYGRRQPGKVRPGNCCLVVARPLDAA